MLEGLPDHPAVKAILAWNADALTDALFDRGELTLTVAPENDLRGASQQSRAQATTLSRT